MAAAANQNNELEQLVADYLEEGIIDEEEWLLINEVLNEDEPEQRGRNINTPLPCIQFSFALRNLHHIFFFLRK